MAFTFKEVSEILRIIDASQCEEVVIELQGLRLVVRRGRPNGAWSNASQNLPPHASAQPASNAPEQKELASRTARRFGHTQADPTAAEGHVAVRAPMVGTFYRRASPQERPFVEVDQRVKKGDPLCLIEVMKLFSTIPAPVDGVLEAIAAEDAAPVEFDQLLFVIKPDA
jgi:acetyl-CoA carboxylase biotin carboxyl carrier protein